MFRCLEKVFKREEIPDVVDIPACKDCKHYHPPSKDQIKEDATCIRLTGERALFCDYIDGKQYNTKLRSNEQCTFERLINHSSSRKMCGHKARFFEAKEIK